MNNFGNNTSLVGITGIVQGDGIVCSPRPITRTGVISVGPAVTAAISKTQHIRTDGGSTIVDGALVIHGPILGEGDIGSITAPFNTVFTGNVITPSNLNALATTVPTIHRTLSNCRKGP